MPLLQWNDSLSVRIDSIDAEHKKLIAMINALHDAMRQQRSKAVQQRVINGLVSYTRIHFVNEERFFDQHGYPNAPAHKQEHAKFIFKVKAFQDDFERGKLTLSLDIMNFLSDWLSDHIKGSDQRYSDYLAAKGVISPGSCSESA
ncbi:bacteriohemerythrin [Lamprobacter modestohalophilus]|uniref:bacteriohemerythrin n=1 Tax=Lamprobacter modestohalophilus TaxID=1064514 RepID=UPI002ADEDE16|nr:bacteriohemerythrin [Lamprobacter modestohalophilus]MEA1050108.1 bacteriohemerythrin [Lamprobacter modestohalophilus]